MPIKGVLIDLDGTLLNNSRQEVVQGAFQMVRSLEDAGVPVFIASNRERSTSAEATVGLTSERFLYAEECGAKGSRGYIHAAMDRLNVKTNELLYLGGSQHDMHEASNCQVPYFNSEWAYPEYEYGIPIKRPSDFSFAVQEFFLKEKHWYFKASGDDRWGRPYWMRALMNPSAAIDTGIRDTLKGWREGAIFRGMPVADFLSMHLLASVYLDGVHLHRANDKPAKWAVYPGSDGKINPILDNFQFQASRLVRAKYVDGLLQRHTPAPSSKSLRNEEKSPLISTQFNTVRVNPEKVKEIKGRTVLVVDDFTTDCHAFETSRNLLLEAGAADVLCIAAGKYGRNVLTFNPSKPMAKIPFTEEEIACHRETGQYDNSALEPFNRRD